MKEQMPEYPLSKLKEVRRVFGGIKNKSASTTFRIALLEEGRTPEELLELRSEFGEGDYGAKIFGYIAAGAKCEAFSFMGIGEKPCGNKAKGSVDFDIFELPNGTDSVLFCSACEEEVCRRACVDSLEHTNGMNASGVGFNGRGRA